MLAQLRLRNPAGLVDGALSVQLVTLNRVEHLATKGVRPTFGHELNLHRALCASVGGQASGRHGDLLDRAQSNRCKHEHARAAASEPRGVVVDAVQRDVDGPTREAVVFTVARASATGCSGYEQGEAQDIAAGERQFRDLFVAHRVGDGRRRRLDHLRSPFDAHLLVDPGELELHDEIDRARGPDHDFLNGDWTEPLERGRNLIPARLQVGEDEAPIRAARGFHRRTGPVVDQNQIGLRYDSARRVLDRADDLAGGAALCGCGGWQQADERGEQCVPPTAWHEPLP